MTLPTLSLCMIVKNEIDFLDTCLRSVAGFVDEIVIADTGSTDGTQEVAKSHGANVFEIPWEDDFSSARNRSIEAASSDWILVLDADEELTANAGELIRRSIQSEQTMGYNLPVRSLLKGGRSVASLLMRLFRNHPDIRFKNLIHEQIHDAVQEAGRASGKRIRTLNAEVLHKGYEDEVYQNRNKDQRNLKILKEQVRRSPDDLYSHMKYAETLQKVQGGVQWEDAVEAAHNLLHANWEKASKRVYAAEICASHATVLERRGREREALTHCREVASRIWATPNFQYTLGRLELRRGQHKSAEELFRKCLHRKAETLPVAPKNGVTGYLSHHALGTALRSLGRDKEAASSFQSAIEDHDTYYAAVESLADLLSKEGEIKKSIQVLTSYLKERPEDSRAWLGGGAIMTVHRLYHQAVPWLERALRSEETATDAARLVDMIQDAIRRKSNPRSPTP